MRLPSFDFGNSGVCTYCGDVSQSIDHVMPVSYQTIQSRNGKMRSFGPQTPSCFRCNSFLSNKAFDTFYDRVQFVHQRWESEVKPILWSHAQIGQLSGWLRNYIAQDYNRRLYVFNRADWADTRDFWLNIENLQWVDVLKIGHRSFHQGLHDYFKSTIALADVVYSELWRGER